MHRIAGLCLLRFYSAVHSGCIVERIDGDAQMTIFGMDMSDKLCRFEKGEAGTVGEDAGMGFLTHAGIVRYRHHQSRGHPFP